MVLKYNLSQEKKQIFFTKSREILFKNGEKFEWQKVSRSRSQKKIAFADGNFLQF
jgi:hypothetical protein